MRTTITLEPDVANLLKEHTREYRVTPKVAINDLLRRGALAMKKSKQEPKKKFKIKSFSLGFPPELRNANFNHVAYMSDEEIEREYYNRTK